MKVLELEDLEPVRRNERLRTPVRLRAKRTEGPWDDAWGTVNPGFFVRLEPSFSEDRTTISVWEATKKTQVWRAIERSWQIWYSWWVKIQLYNQFELHNFPFSGGIKHSNGLNSPGGAGFKRNGVRFSVLSFQSIAIFTIRSFWKNCPGLVMSKNVMFWVLHNLFASKCCKKERPCSLGIWSNEVIYIYIYIYTWIFQVCKICAKNHQKNLPKGRNVTYLEDPGIYKRQVKKWWIFCIFGSLCNMAYLKSMTWAEAVWNLARMHCSHKSPQMDEHGSNFNEMWFSKNGSEVAKQRARQSLMETTILHVMVS